MRSLEGKKIRIALTGGGTGGHVYPLLAVASALKDQAAAGNFQVDIHYYGANDRFRKEIEGESVRFHPLLTGKLRRYFSLMNIIDIPKIFLGTIQALFKLYALMPDVLFSKGGPGAFPTVFAAWFYRIPIVIHESDSVPGLSSLLGARFAKRIGVSFESAMKYFDPRKTVMAGNPVRPYLMAARLTQQEAKTKLGFDPARPLIYVTGGSQGAQALNEFVVLNLGSILPLAQILHQTGPTNFQKIKSLAEAELLQLSPELSTKSRYVPIGYLDMEQAKDALSAADLVLARAGSGSIFEAAAFGKPMMLIPLPGAARDHQSENAASAFHSGAAVVIDQDNLNGSIFMSELQRLFADQAMLQRMAQASAAFAKPDAAQILASAVLEVA